MSLLTIFKVFLVVTVIGLFLWTFRNPENVDNDTLKYGRYMIYLLVLEVGVIVLFSLNLK